MMSDPIADFLIQLKNASMARRSELTLAHSNLKEEIARLLMRQGYIGRVEVKSLEKGKKRLTVTLKYQSKQPVIHEVINVSKPGRRVYMGYQKIPKVLGGMGMVLLSTPNGLMSGQQARKSKVGGEIICKIW